MKTLYIECSMGAAGDMLNAALFDLLEPAEQARYLAKMNSLGIDGLEVGAAKSQKCGIAGTHITVRANGQEEHAEDVDLTHAAHPGDAPAHEHESEQRETARAHDHGHACEDGLAHSHEHVSAAEHQHEHEATHVHDHAHTHAHEHHHGAHMADIARTINAMDLPAQVKTDALAVYRLIAEAEAHAHGKPVEQIHFHEVGTIDAIADVVGFCLLKSMVAPQKIVCSPIHVGAGSVRCAHGVVPVPAPATTYLLQGAPTYGGAIQGELCTPTGAALIRYFAQEFGPQPLMSVEKTGIGCGSKDFPAANIVRVFLGNAVAAAAPSAAPSDPSQATAAQQGNAAQNNSAQTATLANNPSSSAAESPRLTDEIVELACNIDDMTGEEIAFAAQTLIDAGAADAFTTPIGMKKGRPATMITCLCKPADKQRFVELMFKHTTTLGVRERLCNRYILARTTGAQQTDLGEVGFKESRGYGSSVRKYDYDALAHIARENNLSLREAKTVLNAASNATILPSAKQNTKGNPDNG